MGCLEVKNKNILTILSVIALLWASIVGVPSYEFYILLKWLVFITALFIVFVANDYCKAGWVCEMTLIVILYNPIIPIDFGDRIWSILYFVTAVIFLLSFTRIKDEVVYEGY